MFGLHEPTIPKLQSFDHADAGLIRISIFFSRRTDLLHTRSLVASCHNFVQVRAISIAPRYVYIKEYLLD